MGDRKDEGFVDNAKDALKKDWEQTKHDVPGMEGKDLDQDVDDTVREAVTGDER